MKRIYLGLDEEEIIHFSLVKETDPIFAKKDGKLCGMVVHELGKGCGLHGLVEFLGLMGIGIVLRSAFRQGFGMVLHTI